MNLNYIRKTYKYFKMKTILTILSLVICTSSIAQHNKGNWLIGASSSNLGFNSNTGSERKIDIKFTEFQDTLIAENNFINLASEFPYSYEIKEDQNSELNLNFHIGYTILDNFVFGLGFGYDNQTSLFKNNPNSNLTNINPSDSIVNLAFINLPGSEMNGISYMMHYYELYSILAVENDLSIISTTLKIAPFIRYYQKLGKGSLFVNASYEIGSGSEELKDDLNSLITNTEYEHNKINLGLGYTIFLNDLISLEPQFNYYMLNSMSTIVEDVPNPMLFTTDMGTKTNENTRKSSGINFTVGLSFYL